MCGGKLLITMVFPEPKEMLVGVLSNGLGPGMGEREDSDLLRLSAIVEV